MNKKFANIKGTFDYLPEKQLIREKIKNQLEYTFKRYGFLPVETPILSSYELLASKYSEGADILREMYKLTDQGKRELGLRYDLTITFAKLISTNKSIKMPFKRYEIAKVFRDGPVKLGRNREFTQCDVDAVGIKSLMPEADFFAMTKEVFDELGLDVEIEFNNRKLLFGLIESAGISNEKIGETILIIDKLKKISRTEIYREFEKLGIDTEKVERLMEIFTKGYAELKQEFENKLSENIPGKDNIEQGFTELEELYSYIKALQLEDIAVFTPNLARGIAIYTGTVWEIFTKDKTIASSIGAGGRYDKIITGFINDGNQYPAVGMTFGLDVIFEALLQKGTDVRQNSTDVYIVPMDTNPQSLVLARNLRSFGINVDLAMNNQKLRKSLDYANKQSIPYVIVFGENESANGKFKLKKMTDGSEYTFGIAEIAEIAKIVKKNS